MIGRSTSFLGLAVADRTITCAELAGVGDRRTVRRVATFELPADLSLDKPEAVGQALASFLRQKRFGATRAVVGVPARWLIAMDREVPPADEEMLRSMLRLQAERLSVAESGEMLFDYVGPADARQATRVLLVGMRRQQYERVESMVDAAGLSILAITPVALSVSARLPREQSEVSMLLLGRQGIELVCQRDGSPRLLRHVGFAAVNGHGVPSPATLGTELRRAITLASGNGDRSILLQDGMGFSGDQMSQLVARLGCSVDLLDGLGACGVHVDPSALTGEEAPGAGIGQYVPAIALATAATKGPIYPDFRNSRLVAPQQRRFSRQSVWGGILAALLVVSIGSLYAVVQKRAGELAQLEAQLARLAPEIKQAEQLLARATYARGFFDARPPVLECLREITSCFRDDEAIWASSLNLRDNGKGQLNGRATDQRTVLALLDRLKKNPRFSDVKVLEMREAGARTRESSFSMSFTFNG